MQQIRAMTHAPGLKSALGFLLVAVICCMPAVAAASYGPSASGVQSAPNNASAGDVVPLPGPDHGWHAPDAKSSAPVHEERGFDRSLLAVAVDPDGDLSEANDVVRHRGFRKALLIIVVCGALIRLLTSPSYKKFIADVLDPKTF
jgi:hypothetical protein